MHEPDERSVDRREDAVSKQEMVVLRDEAAKEIQGIISRFEDATGLIIEGISVNHIDASSPGFRRLLLGLVELDVRMP